MTLIAAFRCYDGAVLCADTLETSEDGTRAFVHKLEPKETGEYWLAVAGSGHAALIDGFVNALRLDARTWKPQQDEDTIAALIRNVVVDYHDNEVRLFPAPEDEKLNHFLICVKPKNQHGYHLWEIYGTVVLPVGDYSLLGFAAGMYKHEIKRLYFPKFLMQKALILGIHLFSLAKGMSSQYIGGHTDAVEVYDNKEMRQVSVEDMRLLEHRVNAFNDKIARIVLECSDIGSTRDSDLYGLLQNFVEEVMELRGRFLGRPSFIKEMQMSGWEFITGQPEPAPKPPEPQATEPPTAKKKRAEPSKPRKSKGRQ